MREPIAAALLLWLTSAAALDSCASSHGVDDISYKGCYGWCSLAFAKDHCSWCKVSACAAHGQSW